MLAELTSIFDEKEMVRQKLSEIALDFSNKEESQKGPNDVMILNSKNVSPHGDNSSIILD